MPEQDSDAVGRVIVTGGSSSLGAAVVDAVRAAGGLPAVIDRVPLADNGATPFALADVSKRVDMDHAIAALAAELDGFDALVTAAGIGPGGSGEGDPAEWERAIGTHLIGTIAAVRAAVPYLDPVRGRAIIVAVTPGDSGTSCSAPYRASEWGVRQFSRDLTENLRGDYSVTTILAEENRVPFSDAASNGPARGALCDSPVDVAETTRAIMLALRQPRGADVAELVVRPSGGGR